MEEKQAEQGNDMENMKETELNSEKIWKIQKNNCEMI